MKTFRNLREELNEAGVPAGHATLTHAPNDREAQEEFAKRHLIDLLPHPVAGENQFKGTVEPFVQQPHNTDPAKEPTTGDDDEDDEELVTTEDRNIFQNYVVEFDVPGSATGQSGPISVRARTQNEAMRKARRRAVNEGKFTDNTYVYARNVMAESDDQTDPKDRINQRQAGDENVKKFINKELKKMGKDSLGDLSDAETKKLFNKVEYEFSADDEKPDANSKRDKPEK